MDKLPRLSVVMSIYNGEGHLRPALESILNQTFTDFEFLIINDGSTDSTPKILENYKQKDYRIKLINNEFNIGLTRSLNKGIAIAEGDYIARMDADDVAHPDRLKIQIRFMNEHPEVTVCGSALEVYDRPGVYWRPPLGHHEILARLLFECPIYHPTVIFRKNLKSHNPISYNESFEKAQDYDLWARLSNDSKQVFANLPESLLRYRTHSNIDRSFHKQQQRVAADIVRKKVLKKLGIDHLKKGFELHQMLIELPKSLDSRTLWRCSNWLTSIYMANELSGFCNKKALQNELRIRWKKICLNVSNSLSVTPLIFLGSEWGRGESKSLFDACRMFYRKIKKTWTQ